MNKLVFRIVWAFAALIALLVLGFFYWQWSTAGAVKREIARIQAAGEPILTEDFHRSPPVSDDDNAAGVLREAYRLLEAVDAKREADYAARWEEIADELDPDDDRWTLDPLEIEVEDRTEADWAAIEADLEDYAEALTLVAQACEYPDCDFGILPTLEAVLPHLSSVRRTVVLLCERAHIHWRQGRREEAVLALAQAQRVAEWHGGTALIGMLNFRAAGGIVVRTTRALAGERPDDTLAVRADLDDILLGLEGEGHLVRSMLAERAFGYDACESLRSGNGGAAALGLPSGSEFVFRLFLDANELTYLETMREQIEFVRQPFHEVEADMRAKEQELAGETGISYLLTSMLGSVFASSAQRDAEGRTALAITRLGLAAMAYREREGRWPTSPEVLADDFPEGLPADLLTGDPFVMTTDGEDLVIRSMRPVPEPDVFVDEPVEHLWSEWRIPGSQD